MTAPDRWLVLSVRAPSAEFAPLLAEGLVALGGGAVEERGDQLATYLPPPADPDAFLAEARARLAEWLPEGAKPELSWHWQENEDWARKWKEGLRPRRVTDRVVVKPTWTEWEPAQGEVVIDIDPQMAFGTGEHATTRGCLRLLDGALRPGVRVLDVGSGSAILAIAAARLGAAEAVAVEYDPDANLNAQENLELNGVEDRVRIVEAMADPALLRGLGRFDLLLANILSSVIRPLLPAFREALDGSPEGRLIVSGILRAEHADVVRDAEAAGFRVVRTDEEEEWWSALLAPAGSS
ncbi:MAG TPA: 50S ribosomal protein L11 methyltransferase [Longimicrobiaceae bacterium]|nr:50S ribosomal protein L11 methyltransferase [Longimicrobiaceae bacterium]